MDWSAVIRDVKPRHSNAIPPSPHRMSSSCGNPPNSARESHGNSLWYKKRKAEPCQFWWEASQTDKREDGGRPALRVFALVPGPVQPLEVAHVFKTDQEINGGGLGLNRHGRVIAAEGGGGESPGGGGGESPRDAGSGSEFSEKTCPPSELLHLFVAVRTDTCALRTRPTVTRHAESDPARQLPGGVLEHLSQEATAPRGALMSQ
jgi:hypothetical protein